MTRMDVKIFLLGIYEFLTPVLAEMPCSQESISQCFHSSDNLTLGLAYNAQFHVYDDEALAAICSKTYLQMDECLTRHKESCPDMFVNIQATEHALEYLCHDGRESYLAHRTCLKENTLHQHLLHCNMTYHQNMDLVPNMEGSLQLAKMCQYMGEFLSCLREATAANCGTDAGEWVYVFNHKLLSGALDKIQCSTVRPLDGAALWGIIIGCIIAVISLIIIVLLTKNRLEKTFQLRGSFNSHHSRGYSKASVTRTGVPRVSQAYETTFVGELLTKKASVRSGCSVDGAEDTTAGPILVDRANQTQCDGQGTEELVSLTALNDNRVDDQRIVEI